MKGSCSWILLFCAVNIFGQEFVEKSIISEARQVVFDFNVIDQVRLYNSEAEGLFFIKAEGGSRVPGFELKEKQGVVYLRGTEIEHEAEALQQDKVCSIEPNFTSYEIYVPEDKQLYVSIVEGNFYANGFEGELNLMVEDGNVHLSHFAGPVNVKLNAGSIFVEGYENSDVDVKTNLGMLIADPWVKDISEDKKQLVHRFGNSGNQLKIRTIMANVFLNGSED